MTYTFNRVVSATTPAYFKGEGLTEIVPANKETVCAFKVGAPKLALGDILVSNTDNATLTITAVYKAGFDYQGGTIKPGHTIYRARCNKPLPVAVFAWGVSIAENTSLTQAVTPKDAFAAKTVTPPAQPKAAAAKDLFGIADLFERLVTPAIIIFVLIMAYKWTKN